MVAVWSSWNSDGYPRLSGATDVQCVCVRDTTSEYIAIVMHVGDENTVGMHVVDEARIARC